MNRKLYKLITKPKIFIRDYLNKKYPVINTELKCAEVDERVIIRHALSQEKDLLNREESFPIDVVYTWVNKNNNWKNELQTLSESYQEPIGKYGADDARFADHNELYYSLKSIRKYIPWVNQIFIVTNSREDLPDYFEETGVKVITHAEIIDEKYLPTFNSHVIEAYLHKIPDLSEHFIYFNDDVFVARKLPREHFFQSNGLAALYLSSKRVDEMVSREISTPSLLASIYSQNLLSREFGIYVNQILVHTYVPLRKGMYEFAWDLFQKEIESFLPNKFRGNKDINVATFLVPWLMYIHSESSVQTDICYYFNIRSPHAKRQYEVLLNKTWEERPHSICANDFYAENNEKIEQPYQKNLESFLKKYFTRNM